MLERGAPLVVYNSLTRAEEVFRPLRSDGTVHMYSCGPTVYSYAHIGNLRAYVFSDTLHRALLWKGYSVKKVINITDVGHLVADSDTGQDKLENAARNSVQSVYELARGFEAAYLADLKLLRIILADHYPRATEYIPQMIAFAKELERKGFAYRLPSGLYFDTLRDPDYGRLAVMRTDAQREGARVETVAGKRNKTDFAIWRTEQPGERRLMRWESPWGWGAPGWHLECSVMSILLLGPHFDLHTGGVDHRELHHVNEIAQSQAYLGDGTEWVHYWMHNEFLNIKNAKMAKSAQTGLRLSDLASRGFTPNSYRLFLLNAHYRAQAEFSWTGLEAASATLERLRGRIAADLGGKPVESYADAMAAVRSDWAYRTIDRLDRAICDDLSTSRVVAVLQEAVQSSEGSHEERAVIVSAAERLLGLGLDEPVWHAQLPAELESTVARLLAERDTARAARDWAAADRIRDELAQFGVQIKDTPSGTEWSFVA